MVIDGLPNASVVKHNKLELLHENSIVFVHLALRRFARSSIVQGEIVIAERLRNPKKLILDLLHSNPVCPALRNTG